MRRAIIIVLVGLLAAIAGYCAFYLKGTAQPRALLRSPDPEMAWLKTEFKLSDAEFSRIAELHAAYLPRCADLCERIAAKNAELAILLNQTNIQSAAIDAKLAEAGALRVECEQNMFKHFVSVSHQMPAEQGRRYLAWAQARCLHGGDMATQHTNSPAHHH